MTVRTHDGTLPHIKWVELKPEGSPGVLTECVILKKDSFDNLYFIELPNLDDIDKTRIAKILMNRNAPNFELWDLMSQVTLNNGVNALTYFHQLVRVISPTGVVLNPREGVVGTGKRTVGTQNTATDASAGKVKAKKAE